MSAENKKHYTVSTPRYLPFIGPLVAALRDPLKLCMDLSKDHGDIIVLRVAGQKVVQLNHPDLIRHVLVDNHKNYIKSRSYIRFRSALGMGLLTSNGEKWKRDRQRIQPMFNREKIASYYFSIVNEVSEKYKARWLKATEGGRTLDINVNEEMEKITTEVILKSIYGKEIDEEMVSSLHHSYNVMVHYLGTMRLFPNVDLRKAFRLPAYKRFKEALDNVDGRLKKLSDHYRDTNTDRHNLLALLVSAQQQNPDHFSDTDIRDQCATMVFAGFETTTIFMQWFWYMLDDRNDIKRKLREEIAACAPCTSSADSSALTYAEVLTMHYLHMTIKETMRLYPSFWMSGREPVEDDMLGDFKLEKGTEVALPQMALHRHPKWWDEPNSCIPERFTPEKEAEMHEGLYFPFSLGPRRCSGQGFAEMEARTVIAKLLPFFDLTMLNKIGNPMQPGISLKLKYPLLARVSRAH